MTQDCQLSYSTYVQWETYEKEKAESIEQLIDNKKQTVKSWPSNVSTSVIQSCLTDYRSASCYKLPMPCASCARSHHKTKVVFITVHPDTLLSLNLHIFQPSDPFPINFFQEKCDSAVTYFTSPLNGLLLWKPAVIYRDSDQCTVVNLCGDCYSSLIKCKMLCFTLAAHFYHGDLPHKFQDLTWIKK